MSTDSDKPILVTGATSYIGSYIVKTLLDRNHKVRTTVRSLTSPTVSLIRALDPSPNLEIVEADMADTHLFSMLVAGVRAVIHCAMPLYFPVDGSMPFDSAEEAEDKQVKPVLQFTKALIEAAAAAKVRKFVLTSSIAAMMANPNLPEIFDESCWSDEEYCRQNIMAYGAGAYFLVKTLQERLAWDLSKTLKLDTVCINPAYVWGPSLTGRLNASLELLLSVAKGTGSATDRCASGSIPDKYISFVDIREVALAHVLAVERDDAEGRYLLMSFCKHFKDIMRVLRENPAFAALPDLPVDKGESGGEMKFDCSKVRDFGVSEIPWEDTIRESAKALVHGGHLSSS